MTALQLRPQTSFGGIRPTYAGSPAEARTGSRDAVRLLIVRPDSLEHKEFHDIASAFHPGDVLIVNTSATVNGEADATWRTGALATPAVVHVTGPLADGDWVVEVRTAPHAAQPILTANVGDTIDAPGVGLLRLIEPYPATGSPSGEGNRLWRGRTSDGIRAGLDAHGRPIAYGYLDAAWPLAAYQTVFSRVPGSAEMASAGRPFTEDLVRSLIAAGVQFAPVVLHTGFSSQEAGEPPQPEYFEVPPHTARVVNDAIDRGARVVAVGTTATRAIESAVVGCRVAPASGWTERVVTPDDPPRVVTGLITGWHDEDASHLLLVEAVAGCDLAQRAYDAALAADYAWHEFGDSCLLLP